MAHCFFNKVLISDRWIVTAISNKSQKHPRLDAIHIQIIQSIPIAARVISRLMDLLLQQLVFITFHTFVPIMQIPNSINRPAISIWQATFIRPAVKFETIATQINNGDRHSLVRWLTTETATDLLHGYQSPHSNRPVEIACLIGR